MSKQNFRINERIRVTPIRLIDHDNNQVGVINTNEAMSMAKEAGLDLVEVAPNSTPPVCRIMDFGKWLYQQKRKEKLSHKKQHTVVLKEIRLRPKTDDHDRDIKIGHAKKFLEKGHKVQFTLMFRGREMMHLEQGDGVMEEIKQALEPMAKIEREPVKMGRRITMVMVPK